MTKSHRNHCIAITLEIPLVPSNRVDLIECVCQMSFEKIGRNKWKVKFVFEFLKDKDETQVSYEWTIIFRSLYK